MLMSLGHQCNPIQQTQLFALSVCDLYQLCGRKKKNSTLPVAISLRYNTFDGYDHFYFFLSILVELPGILV